LKGNSLYQYAKLSQDIDNRVSRYQAMTSQAAMVMSEAQAAFAFIEPELLQIEDERLREFGGKFPKTDEYDFYLEELIRSRKHIRSTEVEELLAQSAMMARGPDSIFTVLNDADIEYPSISDEDGNKVRLSKQRFIKFLESNDRRVRRDAHSGFMSAYKSHLNTIGAAYSTSVDKDIFFARARRYESCLHDSLDENNIPVTVYHSLIETTESNLEILHKYLAVRKKILGLDTLYPYDMYNPLFPDQNFEIEYENAMDEILNGCRPLGEKYGEILSQAFGDHWIDVYETEGKSGGAFSWGNYACHPFVMMNYNNTIRNMFTLAHEMGHAVHHYLSSQVQPFPKAQYSIFVAEVASTLNEALLQKYMLDKTDDKMMKLFLLNRHIDNTFTTFFHQVFYAHFELKAHELVENGGALSPDKACKIFEELSAKYYGPTVTIDDDTKYKWARIPHFYRTYYVFQYATSYAASQAIFSGIQEGDKKMIPAYLELLSSGGNDHPIEQLKKCGVDMTSPEPIMATLKLFSEQVDEIDRLTQG
jgi:oligoendopeptidase F